MPAPRGDTTHDTVGVDNGITETGMVWRRGETLMGAATIQGSKMGRDLERIEGMEDVFNGVVSLWCQEGCEPKFVFELPILRRGRRNGSANVDTYRIQVRVLHSLEKIARLYGLVYEVMPNEPKLKLTGDGTADKDAMVAASPWAERHDIPRHTREALADAYGIAMCGDRFPPGGNWRPRRAKLYTDEEIT